MIMQKILKQTLKILELIREIPFQVFVVCFVVFSICAVVGLRHNNQTMIALRDSVYQNDKYDGDVNAALNKLRSYVYSHMNTDLSSGSNGIKPPIQLKYTYERLQSAAQAAANNSDLYTNAENYCQATIPASVSVSGKGRISCVQDYISSHGGKAAAEIPVGLYEFDFLSPTWSPDFAGWSLVLAGLSFVGFAAKFLAKRF